MSYILATILALCAVGGLVVDTWSNVVAIGGGAFKRDDTTAYVIAIAILGALAGLVSSMAFQRHRDLGSILVLGWALGTVFSIGASIDRIGGAKDDAFHAVATRNALAERIDQEIHSLRVLRAEEANHGGCGRRCMIWQAKLETAEQRRISFGAAGETNSGGLRVEPITFGVVTASDYRQLHPVVGVIALTVLFNGLFLMAGSLLASATEKPEAAIEPAAPRVDPIVLDLQVNGPANNRELARRIGWSEATVSRRVKTALRAGQHQNQAGWEVETDRTELGDGRPNNNCGSNVCRPANDRNLVETVCEFYRPICRLPPA